MKRSNNGDPSTTGDQSVKAAQQWEDVKLGIDYTMSTCLSAPVERQREMFDERGYQAAENGTLQKIVLKNPVQTDVQNSGCCRIG